MSKKEKTILIVLIAIFTSILIFIIMSLAFLENGFKSDRIGKFPPKKQAGMKPPMGPGGFVEEEIEKTTKKEDVDSGKDVFEEKINLSEQTSNITISKPGVYTLTGEFSHSVLVDANGEVTLNLDSVKIENNKTSAIANISKNPLNIYILENTTNILTDGGSSEYDGCIYSEGKLTIEGKGNLNVHGNQEEGEGIATDTNDITINGGNIRIESKDDGLNAGGDEGGIITINGGSIYIKASGDGIDSNKNVIINGGYVYAMGSSLGGDAGIDTDAGFEINGGTVIALGSDMLEKPLESSKQNSICFNLKSSVDNGSKIILKDKKELEIISFTADENFKTLIISNDKILDDVYNLYENENLIK